MNTTHQPGACTASTETATNPEILYGVIACESTLLLLAVTFAIAIVVKRRQLKYRVPKGTDVEKSMKAVEQKSGEIQGYIHRVEVAESVVSNAYCNTASEDSKEAEQPVRYYANIENSKRGTPGEGSYIEVHHYQNQTQL
ncbi:uncharacterized protein [Watersipora subatra]|uniref:uncharacterized protein n=1 Tax=Watersipora subatra TaxID=2589382 RepID=UPI00355B7F41